MLNPDTLARTLRWFERAVPNPTSKNLHTQLGCHIEEVVEMLENIHSEDTSTAMLLRDAEEALSALSDQLKTSDNTIIVPRPCRAALLDALCDQVVTAAGVGHMLGFQLLDAMNEVNQSNWSKFVNGQPIFDDNMKIQKGPDYFKASLEQYAV